VNIEKYADAFRGKNMQKDRAVFANMGERSRQKECFSGKIVPNISWPRKISFLKELW
jgi:hypothetical protein